MYCICWKMSEIFLYISKGLMQSENVRNLAGNCLKWVTLLSPKYRAGRCPKLYDGICPKFYVGICPNSIELGLKMSEICRKMSEIVIMLENVRNLMENVRNLMENVRNLVENGRKLMENVRNSIFNQIILLYLAPTGCQGRRPNASHGSQKSKGWAALQQLFYYIRPPLA